MMRPLRFNASLPGTLAQKGLLIIGLPTVFQLIFLSTLLVENNELQRSAMKESHYRRLLTAVGSLALGSIQVCAQLNNLTVKPDATSLTAVAAYMSDLRKETDELRLESNEDSETRKMCDDFAKTSCDLQDIFNSSIQILSHGLNRESACELYTYRLRFQKVIPVFLRQHQQLLQESLKLSNKATLMHQRRRALQHNLLIVAAFTTSALGILVGYLFSREIRSRLGVIKNNTSLFAAGKSLLPAISGHDEIKQLDTTFREMVDALEVAQEKERALVTESKDIICSLDANGDVRLFNPAASATFGAALAESKLEDLIAETSKESFRAALVSALEAPAIVEIMIENADSPAVFLSVVVNWSAKQQQFFIAAHNITRRKELERMQRDLYAMIAHDVRSPLMSARAAIELSRAGAPGDAERLRRAEHSIDRVTKLINDLLDIEKIQSGKFEIYPEKISSAFIVQSALDAIQGLVEEKNLTVVNSVENLEFYGDRELLTRVLFNLISNAVKFSKTGGCLYVSCRAVDCEIRFGVRDEGKGISKADQEKLFGRFVQVGDNSSQPAKNKGTGLGLAICKMVVDEHDGKIGVDSEPEKGSEFWFVIPQVQSVTTRDEIGLYACEGR